jgi:hypothetical protein
VQLLRRDIWGSRGYSGSDQRKPFRPSTEEARAHISRQIALDSDGGITRAHSQCLGGAQPPRDVIQSFRGQIFSPTVIERSLEARALILGQFPGVLSSIATRASFPSFAAVVVSFWNCILSIYLCMRRSIYIF